MNLTNIDKLNMLIEQGMFEPVELDEKNIMMKMAGEISVLFIL